MTTTYPMNKLINGTEYRSNAHGYFLTRGKREIDMIARSHNDRELARKIIATISFNKIFNKGIKTNLSTHNQRYVVIKSKNA